MNSYQEKTQQRLLAQALLTGRGNTAPLHEMANTCCSSGTCHSVQYWPVDYPQDGLLQLDGTGLEAIPVDLFAFSSRGVSVALSDQHQIRQGDHGMLITKAHGAGCSYQRVICCWQRLHPQDSRQQCVGLRLVN